MAKENYMALADFQSLWTNKLKPYIVAGYIAVTAVESGATPKLVLQDGTLLTQGTFIAATEKGVNNGVATLGSDGKIPSSQLPSFVDDVLEGYLNPSDGKFYKESAYTTEIPAEGGKIYTDLTNNKTYRWGGSVYTEISAGLALGETQGTAYEGSKGAALKTAYDSHAADNNIHVTEAKQTAWNAKYDKPSGGIPKTDLASAVQASLDIIYLSDINPSDITEGTLTGTIKDKLIALRSAAEVYKLVALHAPSVGNLNTCVIATIESFGSGFNMWFFVNGKRCSVIGSADNTVWTATWTDYDAKYNKPSGGIPQTDLASTVQTSLGKADSAIQGVKVNGTALTPDANKAVDIEVPSRVTSTELEGFTV